MKIVRLNHNSPHLKEVKELWRRNSQALGFFPEGAFEEHASSGYILGAISDLGELHGYLLYRVARRGSFWPRAVIVHLCVASGNRGRGICKALVDKLRELKQESFLRLELKCRRDYKANAIWPRLGFVYKGETIGRADKPLIKWEMDFRELPLIALIEQSFGQKQFRAVIDANVLYRLQDPIPHTPLREKRLSEEAKALDEDWVEDEIALYITDESFNEIQKNDNPSQRKSRLSFAKRYHRLKANISEVREAERRLKPYFPPRPGDSMKSDIRQLAHAIAGDAHFFVTQDTDLLKRAYRLSHAFRVKILSPGEFVGRLDEAIREVEYRPETLAGSHRLIEGRMSSSKFSGLYREFGRPDAGEKKKEFEAEVRSFLAQPTNYEVGLCRRLSSDEQLALIVYDRSNIDELRLPMLRVSRSQLSGTVLRYLLRRAVLFSSQDGRSLVRIPDLTVSPDFEQALIESGFMRGDESWIKCTFSDADTALNLQKLLREMEERFPTYGQAFSSLADSLSKALETNDQVAMAEVERRLWPGRILDAKIPTYIIPIQPYWAQHLFDEELAKQTLWGSKEDLALKNENVYYRSERSSWRIISPARIFWYVKKTASYHGTMSVRACSSLDEVIVGRARDLYRRFKRLGVYKWKDILMTAKGQPHGVIMALRFSNTELLKNPVDLKCIRNILQETEGKIPVLRSPQLISQDSFSAIYRMATKKKKTVRL